MVGRLHHHKLGHGPKILLAFHGIGQDGLGCFKPFEEELGEVYTIYAFDLFFHGKSSSGALFSEPDLITKDIWADLLRQFLSSHGINRFDITGFSMGGKFVLATLEAFPDCIDNVFLIAPDGISEHPLYTLAARFRPARRLFRWCMTHPAPFLKATGFLQNIGLINSSLYRFTQHVLNSPEKRDTVYRSWLAFRPLRFDIQHLYSMAQKNGVQLYLFVGKYDKLLQPAAVRILSDLLPEDRFYILPSGHSTLVKRVANLLSELLPG